MKTYLRISAIGIVFAILHLFINIPNTCFGQCPIRVATESAPESAITSLIYPLSLISGQEVCSTLVYINTADPKIAKPITLTNLTLEKNQQFKVKSITPSMPATLSGGDTLYVVLCFTPNDTIKFDDILTLKSGCSDLRLPISGSGGTPLIYASDIDFGDVVVGGKVCKDLIISNKGNLPFILTKNWLLHNSSVFDMSQLTAGFFPFTLLPGKSITLTLCYSPKTLGSDSTTIDWNTTIDQPFTDQIKSWSFLKGNGVKPGVKWNTAEEIFRMDSTSGSGEVIQRVWLLNSRSSTTHVNKVFIDGPSSSEFSIIGNQLHPGGGPLSDFDMKVGDSIWFDIGFKPDITKFPQYADRIGFLTATYDNPDTHIDDTARMILTGTWAKSDVKQQLKQSSFSIHPNPATGRSVIVSFASPQESKATLQVYNILGREVFKTDILHGISEIEVPVRNLPRGTYFARLVSGNSVSTQKFEIMERE